MQHESRTVAKTNRRRSRDHVVRPASKHGELADGLWLTNGPRPRRRSLSRARNNCIQFFQSIWTYVDEEATENLRARGCGRQIGL
jgi:hypothetical protein